MPSHAVCSRVFSEQAAGLQGLCVACWYQSGETQTDGKVNTLKPLYQPTSVCVCVCVCV